MSGPELYAVELGEDGGDATTIRKLVQLTCTNGMVEVLRRDITDMYGLVRCEACAHRSTNSLVGCGYICGGFGFPLHDRDGFCAWGRDGRGLQR